MFYQEEELAILRILLKHHPKEMSGLDMVKESEGRLKGGTIYVLLDRMEDRGEVTSRVEETTSSPSRIPKRLYGLGKKGHPRLREAKP